MKPYFELKVVKVKKEKKEWTPGCCPCCGVKREAEQPKGNWVNGENLDKIRFPCFCSFDHRKGIYGGKQGVHGIGMINRTAEAGRIEYQLSYADRQMENNKKLDILVNSNVLCSTPSLEKLIKLYDIHILKGKIIIYEEK